MVSGQLASHITLSSALGVGRVHHPERQDLAVAAADGAQGDRSVPAGAVKLPDGRQLRVQRQRHLGLGAPLHMERDSHYTSSSHIGLIRPSRGWCHNVRPDAL